MNISISLADAKIAYDMLPLVEMMGYPNTLEEITQKLQRICSQVSHVLYIAKDDDKIIGFCHAYIRDLLETPRSVELHGLAVLDKYQGKGVGSQLIKSVEEWTKRQDIHIIVLSSNVSRTQAHGFYEHLGYKKIKQQFVFKKFFET
ncbi:MAG: GNAT family N-acetyltransferase [Candidatus Pacebacteria bacterium]|nr:GNAT family N-acetyltransferase [Candidatus Paceibacterota bacterium]